MFRNAYRNFGDHEALVGNITVASGGVAGIRWFEVNNATSGTPAFTQQGTYQPDSTYRWMGSAAMDGNGNLAARLQRLDRDASTRRSATRGGWRATRRARWHRERNTSSTAPAARLDTVSRWGDYSDMTVDPVDDCTFWYTQEYYETTSQLQLEDADRELQVPDVHRGAHGTLEGTVTDAGTTRRSAGRRSREARWGRRRRQGPTGITR